MDKKLKKLPSNMNRDFEMKSALRDHNRMMANGGRYGSGGYREGGAIGFNATNNGTGDQDVRLYPTNTSQYQFAEGGMKATGATVPQDKTLAPYTATYDSATGRGHPAPADATRRPTLSLRRGNGMPDALGRVTGFADGGGLQYTSLPQQRQPRNINASYGDQVEPSRTYRDDGTSDFPPRYRNGGFRDIDGIPMVYGYEGGGQPYPTAYLGGGDVQGPKGIDKVGPVMLSDGEYVLPKDTTQAIGKENLDKIKDATHTPINVKYRGLRGRSRGKQGGGAVGGTPDPNPFAGMADGGWSGIVPQRKDMPGTMGQRYDDIIRQRESREGVAVPYNERGATAVDIARRGGALPNKADGGVLGNDPVFHRGAHAEGDNDFDDYMFHSGARMTHSPDQADALNEQNFRRAPRSFADGGRFITTPGRFPHAPDDLHPYDYNWRGAELYKNKDGCYPEMADGGRFSTRAGAFPHAPDDLHPYDYDWEGAELYKNKDGCYPEMADGGDMASETRRYLGRPPLNQEIMDFMRANGGYIDQADRDDLHPYDYNWRGAELFKNTDGRYPEMAAGGLALPSVQGNTLAGQEASEGLTDPVTPHSIASAPVPSMVPHNPSRPPAEAGMLHGVSDSQSQEPSMYDKFSKSVVSGIRGLFGGKSVDPITGKADGGIIFGEMHRPERNYPGFEDGGYADGGEIPELNIKSASSLRRGLRRMADGGPFSTRAGTYHEGVIPHGHRHDWTDPEPWRHPMMADGGHFTTKAGDYMKGVLPHGRGGAYNQTGSAMADGGFIANARFIPHFADGGDEEVADPLSGLVLGRAPLPQPQGADLIPQRQNQPPEMQARMDQIQASRVPDSIAPGADAAASGATGGLDRSAPARNAGPGGTVSTVPSNYTADRKELDNYIDAAISAGDFNHARTLATGGADLAKIEAAAAKARQSRTQDSFPTGGPMGGQLAVQRRGQDIQREESERQLEQARVLAQSAAAQRRYEFSENTKQKWAQLSMDHAKLSAEYGPQVADVYAQSIGQSDPDMQGHPLAGGAGAGGGAPGGAIPGAGIPGGFKGAEILRGLSKDAMSEFNDRVQNAVMTTDKDGKPQRDPDAEEGVKKVLYDKIANAGGARAYAAMQPAEREELHGAALRDYKLNVARNKASSGFFQSTQVGGYNPPTEKTSAPTFDQWANKELSGTAYIRGKLASVFGGGTTYVDSHGRAALVRDIATDPKTGKMDQGLVDQLEKELDAHNAAARKRSE